jgi:hypothetical protein
MLHKTSYSWPSIALICSPAALPFVGWDVEGFARKEVLGLIILIFLSILQLQNIPGSGALKIVAVLLFGFSILASEVNAVMVPGVVYLLLSQRREDKTLKSFLLALFAIIVALLGVVFSVINSGSQGQASAICNKIQSHGLQNTDLCSGAVESLTITTIQAIKLVLQTYPLYLGYLPLLLLSLLPIITTNWFKSNKTFVFICILTTSPLFIVATDYGRWIFILVMQLTICLMSRKSVESSGGWTALSCVLFICLWGLPHSGLTQEFSHSFFNTLLDGIDFLFG